MSWYHMHMTNQSGFSNTIAWYNQHAEEYTQKIESSPENELMERFVEKLQRGMTVLDAGCAGGRDTHAFESQGLHPTGLDITESFISIAKKRYPSINFICGSFLDLPFESESFDGIWAHASLLHFESISEVKKSLQEFHRVLKAGGIIHVFVKQQLGETKTEEVSHAYSGEFKRFFRFFSKDEMQKYLEETGFEIIDIQDDHVPKDGRTEIKWVVALGKKV